MNRLKRFFNRLLIAWLFPVVTAMGMLGWTLYWFGCTRDVSKLTVTGDACLNRLKGVAGGKES